MFCALIRKKFIREFNYWNVEPEPYFSYVEANKKEKIKIKLLPSIMC